MAEYQVEITRPAERELNDLEPRLASRILVSMETLAFQPRPRQAKKLTGSANSYRLRVGQYRVLYAIHDDQRKVTVFAVGHRREVYR